ncbi:MAG: sigma-70 family RNA polymerase sigma factor [Pirellulales bacterium]|nr:sigma-70 family RNA polymerase sigma factor [Pirellulales bacterium]
MTNLPVYPRVKQDNFIAALLEHQSMIYRYTVTLTCSRADADEVYQSTCLTLWEKWQAGVRPNQFGAWARSIAKNHSRNLIRRNHRQPSLMDEHLLERIHAVGERESAALEERQAALAKCLDALPGEQRTLIESYYQSQDSVKNLAETRNRTVDAIYKTIQRIRAALFDCISRRTRTGET